MTKYSQDWNEGLAQDLKDSMFRLEFFKMAVDKEKIYYETVLEKLRSLNFSENEIADTIAVYEAERKQ